MRQLPSNMIHNFATVPAPQIQRSAFQRDFTHKTTFNAGLLIPIFVDEMLPGDTFTVNATTFARFATPIFPVMDNLFADIQYFFVPNRLVWDNWERFCGSQDSPGDSIDYTVPQVLLPDSDVWLNGTLADYFGLPTQVAGISQSALPFRAYNLIWNEWYRDENLQDGLPLQTGDGPDDPGFYSVLPRGKRKDYFTSALPWPQKGDAVTLPLGGSAPLLFPNDIKVSNFNHSAPFQPVDFVNPAGTSSAVLEGTGTTVSLSTTLGSAQNLAYNTSDPGMSVWGSDLQSSGATADLSSATAATIDAIRYAFQVQRFLERDARGGTRYVEQLWSHWKVVSPDFRLQRPEMLGSQTVRVNIAPVPQTSGTGASGTSTPQGNLAAFGTFSHGGAGFNYSAVEHGHVIGLLSVRADLTYQQGMDRMWSRLTRYDYYWPVFAHLGEQAILNQEIYCQGNIEDTGVFGYQEAFAEYRYKRSMITGQFRSNYEDSLDSWHLSQYFTSLPSLNPAFIVENPPIARVVAVDDEPQFIMDSYFKFRAVRPMPVYSVPGMVDHF